MRKAWQVPFTGLLLILQLVAAGLVPAADAVLELASFTDPVHVESGNAEDCHPGHDHFVCQLCRVAGPKLGHGGQSLLPAAVRVRIAPEVARDGVRAVDPPWTSFLGARAPPLA